MASHRHSFLKNLSLYQGIVQRDFHCEVPEKANSEQYYEQLENEKEICAFSFLLVEQLKKLKTNDPISSKFKNFFILQPENVAEIYEKLKSELKLNHLEETNINHIESASASHAEKEQIKSDFFDPVWEMAIKNHGAPLVVRELIPLLCLSGAKTFLDIFLKNNAEKGYLKSQMWLQIAIAFFRPTIIESLLNANVANINDDYSDPNNISPLYLAIKCTLQTELIEQGKEVIKILLFHGANPDQVCKDITPRELCQRLLNEKGAEYTDILKLVIEAVPLHGMPKMILK